MKVFSMEKVFPIFQKVFADQDTNLERHTILCCEYEEYFSRTKFFDFLFTRLHNIFRTKELEANFFKIYQKLS
jgi:hypothetical protein